jgi:opacity protein-like surface antigen
MLDSEQLTASVVAHPHRTSRIGCKHARNACLHRPITGSLRCDTIRLDRGISMEFRRALAVAGLAICGLGALTSPALARNPADDYVPYHPSGFFVLDWGGFYVGGHLGAAHSLAESTEEVFPNNPVLLQSQSFGQSETSLTGGIQSGWQRQWGRMVGGVEVGYNALGFNNTSADDPVFGLEGELVLGLSRSVEVRDIFLLTGRLGYADGRWLAYAKGGAASAQVDVSYQDSVTGLSSGTGGRETGWTAGIGIDYALTPNLFLGIEYNYIHFRAGVLPPTLPEVQLGGVDIDIQNLVVRLNYRFAAPCCMAPEAPPP